MSLLRQPLLLLARSGRVKQLVSTMPVSAGIVSSYVPGETIASAAGATQGLVDNGLRVTLDYLGEDTLDAEQAETTTQAYLDLLKELSAQGLTRYAEVSVKLSAVGQALPEVGDLDKQASGDAANAVNRYSLHIEECGGMEKIHDCQNNANEEIYMKAYNIIEKYFSDDDEQAEDMAQGTGPNGTFGFAANGAPETGAFNFGTANDSMDM